jgi:hypothetical protein
VERVNLDVLAYTEPRNDRSVWVNGDPWSAGTTTVIVGELPESGSWYARWFGRGPLRPGDCIYTGANAEHYARATARRWMRTVGGVWVEVARTPGAGGAVAGRHIRDRRPEGSRGITGL